MTRTIHVHIHDAAPLDPRIKRGARFYHAQWLDPAKMPAKEALLCQITRIGSGVVYYRAVFDYGDREGLGQSMYEPIESFSKRVKSWV